MTNDSNPPRIYLILGDDESIKTDYVDKIKKKAWPDGHNSTDLNIYYPDNLDMSEVIQILQTTSLFGTPRIVILKKVDKFLKNDKDMLLDYLDNPNRTSVLILEALDHDGRQNKFINKLKDKSHLLMATSPKSADRLKYLMHELKTHNIDIDVSTSRIVMEMAPENFSEFKQFTEALMLYCLDKKKVEREDVFVIYEKPDEYRVFEISNCLMKRDIKGALKQSKLHTEKGGEIYEYIGLLAWALRKTLSQTLEGNARGRYSATGLSHIECQKALDELAEIDIKIKTGIVKNMAEIDYWLISILSGKAA